jgi:uncharacterized membrane protein YphA (DoxX/SURF4 family)
MQDIIIKNLGLKKILSLFPELYNYSGYAPLILRFSAGVYFIGDGWEDIGKRGGIKLINILVGSLKIISGVALTIGIYTQLWAAVACVLLIFSMIISMGDGDWIKARYNFLLIVIAASLILSGPGLYAMDLPL